MRPAQLCAVAAGVWIAATASLAPAAAHPVPVVIAAADRVKVYADYYPAPHPKALILLFHQAGSSKAEYAGIAPRLVAQGYAALAIDQRSGGALFGPNRTAAALPGKAGYLDAKADLEAALAWAVPRGSPIMLWGSSYSAALVFLVAADHPDAVAAVLAFSPGEYLDRNDRVRTAAARVHVPVYVTSARNADEIASARTILAASPARLKQHYVPTAGGVHGSSTLLAARDPEGAEANWQAVSGFLKRVAP